MRIFRKIIVVALILGGVLLVAASILGRIFEDELTQYVVGGLNRHIRTEVKVEDVKLSFIKGFPDATLEFQNVFIASVPDFQRAVFAEQNTDTLLVAANLFLRFNVLKLLKHQYLVKEVKVRSGKLNLYIDRAGNGNYLFWGKREGGPEKDFLLALDNVKLDDVYLNYDNRALEINVEGLVQKSYFRGRLSMDSYRMSAGFEGIIRQYRNKGAVLLKEQEIFSEATLFIDPQSIEISGGDLILAGQHLLVSGKILRPRPLELDISLEGKQLDLEYLIKHIVSITDKYPEDLRAGGKLSFRGQVRGIVSNTKMPGIEADFSLQDGWLNTSLLKEDIRELKTRGSYSNGTGRGPQTTRIQLNGLSLRFGNSRLGGDYSVQNLLSPDFNYKIKADLDLQDIQNIMSADSLFESMQGRVQAEVQMKGDQALLENFNKTDLLNYDYQATIRLEGLNLQWKKVPLRFKNFSGDAVFTDHLNVKNLNGLIEESQVSLNGRVDNFLEYLLTPDGNLWMDVNLYSERMDLNYLRSINSGGNERIDNDTLFLPERLYLKTRFWFDELEIKDFKAEQVTGDLVYQPGRLNVTHLELLSMDGRVESEGIFEQQKDMGFLVKSLSRVYSADITKAFSSFNNFGQNFIVDRHIKGSLSGTVNFSTGLNERMKIKKETILADCDIVIQNGQLSGFEPMMKLSRFIDVAELENIQFSTLTNEVFIRNEEVVIPKMDIHSSAFDITASGIHGFDKNFTYKVKVSLSELLAKKSASSAGQDSEFGIIEDDGLGRVYLYLIIEGTPERTDVRYDRRGAIQNIREQLTEEKLELREILKEELGLFKKDSSITGKGREPEPPEFIIEWDENADSIKKEDIKKDNISGEERFIIEWDEDENDQATQVPEKKKKRKKKKE